MEILRFMTTCQKLSRWYKSRELWHYLLSKHNYPHVEPDTKVSEIIHQYDNQIDLRLTYRKLSMTALIDKICYRRYPYGDGWVHANIYGTVMILHPETRSDGSHVKS